MPHLGRVLIIAGSDSGGGAGVQADIKTVTILGGYAASAITAVTVQNTLGVSSVHPIPPEIIAAQARAVLSDIGADAIKTGMLGDAATVALVAELLDEAKVPAVIDPVMVAKGGASLLAAEAVAAVRGLLIPCAALLTPNAPEAEALTGLTVETTDDLRRAGEGGRAGGAHEGRPCGRRPAGRCPDDAGGGDGVRRTSDRDPSHSRHRLHPGLGLRGGPGAGSIADAGRGAGLGLCALRH
jgi:hydroxymethylpyrimidine/phosphomethylpyrimidine kinase